MKTNTKPQTAISRRTPKRRSNWQYYSVAVICCALLVAGFFFAARQHFSSMEYGLQNSRLRRELDELQSEKRRLLLSREVSMTPAELKKAVRRVGFVDDTDNIKTASQKSEVTSKPSGNPEVPSANGHINKVVATVINAPVNKPEHMDKQARRDPSPAKKNRT